jgi:hypothetical protein
VEVDGEAEGVVVVVVVGLEDVVLVGEAEMEVVVEEGVGSRRGLSPGQKKGDCMWVDWGLRTGSRRLGGLAGMRVLGRLGARLGIRLCWLLG